MTRLLAIVGLVLAVFALGVAVTAHLAPRQPNRPLTAAELRASGVQGLAVAGSRMTPTHVRAMFGSPDEVYRNDSRALCWRYRYAYELDMCWSPNRKLFWYSNNLPLDVVLQTSS